MGSHSACCSSSWGSEVLALLEEMRLERKLATAVRVRSHGGHLSAIVPEATYLRESL